MKKTEATNVDAVNENKPVLAAHEAALAKVEAARPAAAALVKSLIEAGCSDAGATERHDSIDVWCEVLPATAKPWAIAASAGATFQIARIFHQASGPDRLYFENVVGINPTERK